MSPRRYRSDTRQAAAEETRRKIVEAAVELHAEMGTMAATYAKIAERAGVAIPTVYNHFPALCDVLTACTGHVAAQAPPFGPDIFAGIEDAEKRLRALARAILARHRFYAPWMRWAIHEAMLVPELAAVLERARPTTREMIELALRPEFGVPPPPALAAMCEAMLDFRTAQILWNEQTLSAAKAEETLGDALVALAMHYRSKTQSRRKTP
jgi:AcrR family transcriptional regulator